MLRFNIIPCLIITGLIVFSNAINSYAQDTSPFTKFSERSYFTEIFSNSDKKILAKADKIDKKGDKKILQVETLRSEMSKYRQLAKDSKIEKNRLKADKKAKKIDKKIWKLEYKALIFFEKANKLRYEIYHKNFKLAKTDSFPKGLKKGVIFMKEAEILFKNANKKRQGNTRTKVKSDVYKLQEAHDFEMQGFNKMLSAYDACRNIKTEEEKKKEKDLLLNKNKKAKPEAFLNVKGNLFTENEKLILPKLNLTNGDYLQLKKAHEDERDANSMIDKGFSKLEQADAFDKLAKNTSDLGVKSENLTYAVNARAEGHQVIYDVLQKHNLTNELRYLTYKSHIISVRIGGKSAKAMKGEEFEKKAQEYFNKAKLIKNKAKFINDKKAICDTLMDAKVWENKALENIENAYAIYLNIPSIYKYVPVEKTTKPIVNETKENKVIIDTVVIVQDNIKETEFEINYDKLEKNKKVNNPKKDTGPTVEELAKDHDFVFKIQFGLIKKAPKNVFDGKYKISHEKKKNSDLSFFYAGEYKASADAKTHLREIQKTFSDAYIVAFIGGKKVSLHKAMKIIKSGKYKKTEPEYEKISVGEDPYQFIQPIDIKTIGGLFYTVQLGTFKNPVKHETFLNLTAIYGERLKSGAIRYTSGMFDGYKKANQEKKLIIKSGIKEAFVIAFHNGMKISTDDARKIQARKDYKKSTPRVIAYLKPGGDSDKFIKPINITNTEGIFYTIQLGVFKNPVEVEKLSKFLPIYGQKLKRGTIKYTSGNYSNFKKAITEKNKIVKSGFKNAYVIAYFYGKQIDLIDAQNEQKNPGTLVKPDRIKNDRRNKTDDKKRSKKSTNEIVFKVELASYSKDKSIKSVEKALNLNTKRKLEKQLITGGKTIYTIGNFETFNEADNLRKSLAYEGIEGVVIAVRRNEKLPVDKFGLKGRK
jgi:hypothetical protein